MWQKPGALGGGTELTGGRERQHPSRMTLDGRKGVATLAAAWEGEAGSQMGSAKGGNKGQAGRLQPREASSRGLPGGLRRIPR